MILGYTLFGVLWIFFHWCKNFLKSVKIYFLGAKCWDKLNLDVDVFSLRCISVSCLILVMILVLGLIVVISCYFVFIPINKAISDTPRRIISIYESGGFVLGSVIVYKILYHFYRNKTDNIENIYNLLQKRLPARRQSILKLSTISYRSIYLLKTDLHNVCVHQ